MCACAYVRGCENSIIMRKLEIYCRSKYTRSTVSNAGKHNAKSILSKHSKILLKYLTCIEIRSVLILGQKQRIN